MAKATPLQEAKARMQELQEKRAAELGQIRQKREEAQAQKDAALKAEADAMEKMALEEYAEAKRARQAAQIALDMYAGRYEQLNRKEFLSEKESDAVIDGLLAYEDELTESFKASLSDFLQKLEDLYKSYTGGIADTEATIRAWCSQIHENYRTRGRTLYVDHATGGRTDRSERPVPVRPAGYVGCGEAQALGDYLKSEAARLGKN